MEENKVGEINITNEFNKGRELFDAGNYVDAKEIFEELFKNYPDHKEVQNYYGMVLFKLGLHKEAMDLYKRLLEKVPNFPSLHLNLGIIYYKEGLLELAFEEFINTLEFDPKNKRAQNYIGLIHMAKGNYEEALATFSITGSKKMIKDVKEKIREEKRSVIQSKGKADNGVVNLKDLADEIGEKKEILKGKDKLNFADIKKSLSSIKTSNVTPLSVAPASIAESVSTVKDTAEDLMRNVFKGGGTDFIDFYQNLMKINVKSEVYTRLSLLESFSGDLSFKGAYRIIQKKQTEIPLGATEDLIFNVFGRGSLILCLGSLKVTAFTLNNEDFYVQEKCLLAFEKSISYENSSSEFGEEFDLVKLSGKGTVILFTENKPFTQIIDENNPLAIKLEYIVGWYGGLSSNVIKGKEGMFKRREDSKWVTFKGNGFVFCLVKD